MFALLLLFVLLCAALAAGVVWAGFSVLYLSVVLTLKLLWLPFQLLLGVSKAVFFVAALLVFVFLKLVGLLGIVGVVLLGLFVIWAVSRLLGAGRKNSRLRGAPPYSPEADRVPVAEYDPWSRQRSHVGALRSKFERLERRLAHLEAVLSER
jgi:hypothetical protein